MWNKFLFFILVHFSVNVSLLSNGLSSYFYYCKFSLLIVFTPALIDDFWLDWSDRMSPLVYRILFSILADITNAIVWIFFLLSSDFKIFKNHYHFLRIVPNAPLIIGITVHIHVLFFSSFLQGLDIISLFAFF